MKLYDVFYGGSGMDKDVQLSDAYLSRMADDVRYAVCTNWGGRRISREELLSMKSDAISTAASLMGRKGGSSKSEAKQGAARANGKMGGRPREKNRALSHRIIVDKIDTGNEYSHLDRYQEMDKPELPRVGVTYLVWVSEYVGPNRMQRTPSVLHFSNDERMVNEGFPGNSDHTVRRFHGWRGTTDDYAIHAMGVRECVGVECIDHQKTVHYRISFSPDLKFDQD